MTSSRDDRMSIKPAYIVVFPSQLIEGDSYLPIFGVGPQETPSTDGTLPHGLDKDLLDTIYAMWYCLHLPRTLFDLTDLTCEFMKAIQDYDFDHEIVLTPSSMLIHVLELLRNSQKPVRPVLILAPDALVPTLEGYIDGLADQITIAPTSTLSNDTVVQHWKLVYDKLAPSSLEYLGREPKLTERLDIAPFILPLMLLTRQFAESDASLPIESVEQLDALGVWGLRVQAVIATLARMARDGISLAEADSRYPDYLEEERATVRFPISIGAPGVPSRYVRAIYGSEAARSVRTWPVLDQNNTLESLRDAVTDYEAERSVIALMVTHRAAAREGMGIMLSSIEQRLFQLLSELEVHCLSQRPKPRFVWHHLGMIGELVANTMSDRTANLICHASLLTVFSNFPIGLAILPGDTSPLCCRVPIAYRPLLPLTRALQTELSNRGLAYIGTGFKVLIAECIDPDDPVGKLSRKGWDFIQRWCLSNNYSDIIFAEISDPGSLRRAVQDCSPDILVLSAHGVYLRERNVAGIKIGKEVCIGPELGRMPAFVILSACTTSPRGIGTVGIADLLIRQGAYSVLAAQVPVDVYRNVELLTRLFVYINETLEGREKNRSIAEVWHRTASYNAVNDIFHANKSIRQWAMSDMGGQPVLAKFMLERATGRLRLGSIYDDTEAVLQEMAHECGIGDKFAQWMSNPGYTPETLFYHLIGWPERIVVHDPIIDSIRQSMAET